MIDLCIVAGRRPDLIKATIKSFKYKVFSGFAFRHVFVNIDPIFGTIDDLARTKTILRDSFPVVTIFEPQTASFGEAVKRLWRATSADFIFHLEDDWIALASMGPEIFTQFADPKVAQLSFQTKEKDWNVKTKGHFHNRQRFIRLLGVKIPLFQKSPIFTTSPSVIRGDFARASAELMIGRLDPEKQFYKGTNPALESYVAPFRNYIFSPSGMPVIEDIGRFWRDAHGIEKTLENGAPIWSRTTGEGFSVIGKQRR
jgi:hypothetical protein